MISVRDTQSRFSLLVGKLILYAYANGFELTFGDAQATTGHKTNSLHYSRRAIDLNLFVDGEYVRSSEHPAWKILHDYFEEIGGDPMIQNDANHFQLRG